MSKGSTYLRKDGHRESRLYLGTISVKRQSRSFYGSTKEEAEASLHRPSDGSVLTETSVITAAFFSEHLILRNTQAFFAKNYSEIGSVTDLGFFTIIEKKQLT